MPIKPRFFLLTGSLLLSCTCAFSQQKLPVTGQVSGPAGSGLPYASVYVEGTSAGTTTARDGRYSLSLAPGDYTLVCRYLGYETATRKLHLGAPGARVDFVLRTATLSMAEVVVKGADPAVAIMRHAIRMRSYYENQVMQYRCRVYVKGVVHVEE